MKIRAIDELQDEAHLLSVRMRTAKTSLNSIKEQMASQGLGWRANVVAAETRMTYLMEKAQKEIAAGDAVGAEHDLEMAGHVVEFIEKFLGH